MTRPPRIRCRRTKGWRLPEGALYVGRPSAFGNPFHQRDRGHERAVAMFREWLLEGKHQTAAGEAGATEAARRRILEALPDLRGRPLACWCPLDGPCHAEVLLDLANR